MKFYSSSSSKKGFTLIELLVVISIIGLLSSVVISSVNEGRAKGRNTFRKAQLRQLQAALEIYYNQHGEYPITGSGVWYSSNTQLSTGYGLPDTNASDGGWIPHLAESGAITSLPQDPLNVVSMYSTCDKWTSAFLYKSIDGKNYKLSSHCAPEGTWTSADTFYDAQRPTWAWSVVNNPTLPPVSGGCGTVYFYADDPLYPMCW